MNHVDGEDLKMPAQRSTKALLDALERLNVEVKRVAAGLTRPEPASGVTDAMVEAALCQKYGSADWALYCSPLLVRTARQDMRAVLEAALRERALSDMARLDAEKGLI